MYSAVPYIVCFILFVSACIFQVCAIIIYWHTYLCSDGLHYYENVSCLRNCIFDDAHIWNHQLIESQLFLVCLAWCIGRVVTSLKWTVADLLSMFLLIYPLLQNKLEVKLIDVCLSASGYSNTTQFSSDAYIIQQAVVSHHLFGILNILSFTPFCACILYLVVRQLYKRCSKTQSTTQQNTNQNIDLLQYLQDGQLSIENTTEKHLLIHILMKVSDIEEKLLGNENKIKKMIVLNDGTKHESCLHCFARFCHVVCLVYLIPTSIILLIFFFSIVFAPDALQSNKLHIVDLFSPIKYDNTFMRKQILHFMSLLATILFARAVKYAPNEKQTAITKDMLSQYLRQIF